MTEEIIPPVHDEILFQENKNLEILKRALEAALVKVFGEGEQAKRFVDVTRIPLICKSIIDTQEGIKTMKEEHSKEFGDIKKLIEEKMVSKEAFLPVKNIVYGAVGIILIAVFTALVYLVVVK